MSDGNPVPGIFDGMAAYPGKRGHDRPHPQPREPPPGGRDPGDRARGAPLRPDAVVQRRQHEGRDRHRPARRGRSRCSRRSPSSAAPTRTAPAGRRPWDSWITCEEVVNRSAAGVKHGYNFDIPSGATGPVKAEPIRAAGRFVHEASLFHGGVLYETEDRSRSASNPAGAAFYRYIPNPPYGAKNPLWKTTGVLQALKLKNEPQANMDVGRTPGLPLEVEWVTIDTPDHDDDTDSGPLATRNQAYAKGAAAFNREEGMWVGGKKIYFDVTNGGAAGQGQVWEYDPERELLTLIFESPSSAVLQSPDNVVIVPKTGHIFLQEDGAGEQFVRGVTRNGAHLRLREDRRQRDRVRGRLLRPARADLLRQPAGRPRQPPRRPAERWRGHLRDLGPLEEGGLAADKFLPGAPLGFAARPIRAGGGTVHRPGRSRIAPGSHPPAQAARRPSPAGCRLFPGRSPVRCPLARGRGRH